MNVQLKRLRNLKGLSQEDMANKLGIKVSRYGTWERGERTMSFPQAIACAEILGCTTDELAGRTPVRSYSDPSQGRLNSYYESLNDKGRERLVEEAEMLTNNKKFAKSEDHRVSKSA